MVRLVKVERGSPLTTSRAPSGDDPRSGQLVDPVVRRWDHGQREGTTLGAARSSLDEDPDYTLERGIKIRFRKPDAEGPYASMRRGDYWAFPARTATADIEWPSAEDHRRAAEPRQGLSRPGARRCPARLAPLAVVTAGAAAGPHLYQRTINTLWSPV